jgi:hypothetical protein
MKIKRIAISALLLVGVFFGGGMSGCAVVTRFEQYDLSQIDVEQRDDGTRLHVAFGGTKTRSWIVPGFFESEVTQGPFRHNVVVWGNFPRLESVTVAVRVDDREPTRHVVDVGKMNVYDKKSSDGRNIFAIHDGGYRLDIEKGNFETVEFVATIEVLEEGELKTIVLRNLYEKRHRKDTGNRLCSAIMSV